ncbi:hypothetical protein [Desulforhopalus singaporensis]|uniref:Uncharacterized protein n=1 Tax=Desulforhopalus singaporensis TaxID=91360 RepID=A0A1H0NTR9_9BACT|nr:hypothetical protein [Desulforhopalus singaporensis]SDO95875.1 hypothetical protein SAMN05660330_01435 [Desulforhopalus singaporensis]
MPRLIGKIEVWFPYMDDEKEGRVLIQNLTDEDLSAIKSKALTERAVYDPERNTTVTERVFNQEVDRAETAIRTVKDWEGFFDEDGVKMECTDQNKARWSCSSQFMVFINGKRKIVDEQARERAKAASKN